MRKLTSTALIVLSFVAVAIGQAPPTPDPNTVPASAYVDALRAETAAEATLKAAQAQADKAQADLAAAQAGRDAANATIADLVRKSPFGVAAIYPDGSGKLFTPSSSSLGFNVVDLRVVLVGDPPPTPGPAPVPVPTPVQSAPPGHPTRPAFQFTPSHR